MATKIPEDLVEFLESGVSILVGTRNAKNEPEPMRASGQFRLEAKCAIELETAP